MNDVSSHQAGLSPQHTLVERNILGRRERDVPARQRHERLARPYFCLDFSDIDGRRYLLGVDASAQTYDEQGKTSSRNMRRSTHQSKSCLRCAVVDECARSGRWPASSTRLEQVALSTPRVASST